jgi:hypothetical protein
VSNGWRKSKESPERLFDFLDCSASQFFKKTKRVFTITNVGCHSVPAVSPWKFTAREPHSITISSGRKWRPTADGVGLYKEASHFVHSLHRHVSKLCFIFPSSFQGIQPFKYTPSRIIDTNVNDVISRNSRGFFLKKGRGNVLYAERKMLSTRTGLYLDVKLLGRICSSRNPAASPMYRLVDSWFICFFFFFPMVDSEYRVRWSRNAVRWDVLCGFPGLC